MFYSFIRWLKKAATKTIPFFISMKIPEIGIHVDIELLGIFVNQFIKIITRTTKIIEDIAL